MAIQVDCSCKLVSMSRFFMSAQIALVLIFMIVSSTKGFQNGMKIFTKKAAPLSCRSHFSAISSAVKFLDEALILQGRAILPCIRQFSILSSSILAD